MSLPPLLDLTSLFLLLFALRSALLLTSALGFSIPGSLNAPSRFRGEMLHILGLAVVLFATTTAASTKASS